MRIGLEARIPRSEIERLKGSLNERLLVLYGRVSGQGQKDDLETQIERLQAWAKVERPGRKTLVLSDIGSGLSPTRKQLSRLLKMVCEDRVGEVAVTYGDRLTRFGQEYLETLFESLGVTLTILYQSAYYDRIKEVMTENRRGKVWQESRVQQHI